MKITLVQPRLVWDDKKANLDILGRMIGGISAETDLIILPEMFNTGFSVNSPDLSEPPFSETYNWMKRISEEKHTGICGSFIVKEKAAYYNRFFFVSGENLPVLYDKRHLFGIGGEDKNFSPGNTRVVFSYCGFGILPVICYDLRFPVWIRNRNDYDLIVCVANWPESRRDVWKTLLKARAIENQCYVAGVNCVGTDTSGNSYSGDSMVLGPKGDTMGTIMEYEEGLVTVELKIDELYQFRSKFPAWKDADNFNIL